MQPVLIGRIIAATLVEAAVVALVVASAITACACAVHLNPWAEESSVFQTVLFVLNLPALVIWLGGGEHDHHGVLFRICVFLQWLVIGEGLGLMLAVGRRLLQWHRATAVGQVQPPAASEPHRWARP